MYKVKFRKGGRSNEKHSKCLLPVSVGKEYHEGEKLRTTIEWINKRFTSCEVQCADTLQRHNFLDPEGIGRARSLELGSIWLERNREILAQLEIPCEIVRWDEYLAWPDFNSQSRRIRELFETDLLFSEAVNEDIERLLKKHKCCSRPDYNQLVRNCINYVLEEAAVDTMIYKHSPSEQVYPGSIASYRRYIHEYQPRSLTIHPFNSIGFLRKKVAGKYQPDSASAIALSA